VSGSVFEAAAVLSGLLKMAVMGETIKQSGGHLGVVKDAGSKMLAHSLKLRLVVIIALACS